MHKRARVAADRLCRLRAVGLFCVAGAILPCGRAARSADLTPPHPSESHAYRPYPPVELTSLVFDSPRPIRAWTVEIDLTSPDVQLVTTPRGNFGDSFETACSTTMDFAEKHNVQLAVNGSPFSPFRMKAGEGMDVIGLAASDGDVYSPPSAQYGALATFADGSVKIIAPPFRAETLSAIDDAVGGFHVLATAGTSRASIATAGVSPEFAGPNPRTAVALSANGHSLWLIVVDGRNPGRSEGMTIEELTGFALSLGCESVLNLDGGGSTTLVMQDPASRAWRLLNQPVGRKIVGTERLVANNLGVRVRMAPLEP